MADARKLSDLTVDEFRREVLGVDPDRSVTVIQLCNMSRPEQVRYTDWSAETLSALFAQDYQLPDEQRKRFYARF